MSTFEGMRARPADWPPDGWGRSVRIGVLVPHADVGPESELRRRPARSAARTGYSPTAIPAEQ